MINGTDADGTNQFTQYGAFEDSFFWDPIFASGELPESMRHIITDPKESNTALSLWHTFKWAELHNSERARDQLKVDKYGLLIIKKRVITETAWIPVTPEEIEAVRRT